MRALVEMKLDACGYAEDEEGGKAAVGREMVSIRWLLACCLSRTMSFRTRAHLCRQGVLIYHDPIPRDGNKESGGRGHGNKVAGGRGDSNREHGGGDYGSGVEGKRGTTVASFRGCNGHEAKGAVGERGAMDSPTVTLELHHLV